MSDQLLGDIIEFLRIENPGQITGAIKILGIDFETLANLANPETKSTTQRHLSLHVESLRHRLPTTDRKDLRRNIRKIERAQATIEDFTTGITLDGKVELIPRGTIGMLSRLVVTSHGWRQQRLRIYRKGIDMYYIKDASEIPDHGDIPFPGKVIGKSYLIPVVKVNELIEWIDRVGDGKTGVRSSSSKVRPSTRASRRESSGTYNPDDSSDDSSGDSSGDSSESSSTLSEREFIGQLKLPANPSDATIKKAWRKFALKNHPNRDGYVDVDTFNQVKAMVEKRLGDQMQDIFD